MEIHIQRDGQQMGPYTLEQINEYLAQGSLLATDHAWHEGLPQWVALNEIAGVVSNQAATSSPPPFNPSVAAVPEKVGNGSGFLARHKNIIIPVAVVVTIVGSIVVYDLIKTRREQSAVMKGFARESIERLNKPRYVRFDSRHVEKAIREELKKPAGSIYPADLEKVTNLDLTNP